MAHVTPDDFRSEKWTDGLGIHGSFRDLYFTGSIYESGSISKTKYSTHEESEGCYIGLFSLGCSHDRPETSPSNCRKLGSRRLTCRWYFAPSPPLVSMVFLD